MWTDNHCHDLDAEVVAVARQSGVGRFITVGTDAAQSRAAIDVAQANEGVWATVGLHPHDAVQGVDTIVGLLDEALLDPDNKVVAVGEAGLDYHYDHSPRPEQRQAFADQIRLAQERDLALVIHTREAWDDTFDVLAAEGVPARTIFHCFTGGASEAQRCLDLGAYLSFSGIVTFKAADDVREAAALCPLDRLLVETDSPYLTPMPHRGKRNQPAFVPLVGAGVAAAKGVAVDDVEAASTANAVAAYRLPV